jgi:hypothetical protein
MSRMHTAGLLPLLIAVASALAVPAAQATEPHWYRCEKASGGTFTAGCTSTGSGYKKILLGASPKTEVTGSAGLDMTVSGIFALECKVGDKVKIWNPSSGSAGEDEITEFSFAGGCANRISTTCPTPVLEAKGLPWKTLLLAGPPIEDESKASKWK